MRIGGWPGVGAGDAEPVVAPTPGNGADGDAAWGIWAPGKGTYGAGYCGWAGVIGLGAGIYGAGYGVGY